MIWFSVRFGNYFYELWLWYNMFVIIKFYHSDLIQSVVDKHTFTIQHSIMIMDYLDIKRDIPCVGASMPIACPQSFREKISCNACLDNWKFFWAPIIFYLHVDWDWTIPYKSDHPAFQV